MIFSKHTYDIGKTPLLKHNIIVSDIPKKTEKKVFRPGETEIPKRHMQNTGGSRHYLHR